MNRPGLFDPELVAPVEFDETLRLEGWYSEELLTAAFYLSAATGTFVETGNAASLNFNRTIVAGTGAFTETGNDASLTRGIILVAGTGVFTESGNAANLLNNRSIAAGTGVFVETGNPATLKHDFKIAAGTGAFVETGNDADLIVAGGGTQSVIETEPDFVYALILQEGIVTIPLSILSEATLNINATVSVSPLINGSIDKLQVETALSPITPIVLVSSFSKVHMASGG